jgi:hypothetical protein
MCYFYIVIESLGSYIVIELSHNKKHLKLYQKLETESFSGHIT